MWEVERQRRPNRPFGSHHFPLEGSWRVEAPRLKNTLQTLHACQKTHRLFQLMTRTAIPNPGLKGIQVCNLALDQQAVALGVT